MTDRQTITETGCYFDNARGHYITRDVVQFAIDHGFLVDPFTSYALDRYETWSEEGYEDLYQSLYELSDEVADWLNCGDNEGLDRPIKGQNSPPVIPEGYGWDWNDGDFGLYTFEEES